MPTGKLVFRFTAPLVQLDQGMRYHALPVPAQVATAWKKARVRRLVGTINGVPVKRALKNHADGDCFLIVGRDLMEKTGLSSQKPATLELGPDRNPDQLDIPPEFELALQQDPAARARWNTFTVGRQRSLLIYITGAKTEPTRIKRSVILATQIATHRLYGDLRKKEPPIR